jgi:hypothetical protein
MSETTHLMLPYLAAAQAQKHVTHNEALRLLDAMVQLAVLDRTRSAPPASPADGDRHLVASGATGLWAGWDLNIAYWVDGAWTRLVPRPGWLAWIAAEGIFASWTGSAWQALGAPENVSDAVFSLVSDSDPTKKALFNLSGLSTGTTRTFTLPNTWSELAILAGPQTFSGNKTSSGTLTASGATATIGTATGAATYGVGTGATASGSTKTVNLGTGGASGSTTVVNIGSATGGAGGTTVVNTPTVTFANAVTQVGMPQANLTAQQLGLGGATVDSYNRLSVNAPALLFNHAGGGIEATFNKNASANDAAFAFKTGFSARALIGLLGAPRRDGNQGHAQRSSGAHTTMLTALWLQTLVPLAQGETVELQGAFRAADGYSPPTTRRSGAARLDKNSIHEAGLETEGFAALPASTATWGRYGAVAHRSNRIANTSG